MRTERAPCMFDGDYVTLRCLVVDDHRDGAEALGAVLTMLGLDVRVAYSGRAAIELAHEFQPRLVVLDINMPGLDGFETVKRLRQQSGHALRSLLPIPDAARTGKRRCVRRLSPRAHKGRLLTSARSYRSRAARVYLTR